MMSEHAMHRVIQMNDCVQATHKSMVKEPLQPTNLARGSLANTANTQHHQQECAVQYSAPHCKSLSKTICSAGLPKLLSNLALHCWLQDIAICYRKPYG